MIGICWKNAYKQALVLYFGYLRILYSMKNKLLSHFVFVFASTRIKDKSTYCSFMLQHYSDLRNTVAWSDFIIKQETNPKNQVGKCVLRVNNFAQNTRHNEVCIDWMVNLKQYSETNCHLGEGQKRAFLKCSKMCW